MHPSAPFVTQVLSLLTILAQVVIVGVIVTWMLAKTKKTKPAKVIYFLKNNSLRLAFVVAVTATAGSLYYSEVAKYTPCLLCWWQRIFMYPQTVLLGMMLVRRDLQAKVYSIALSLIGGGIAAYHYLLQTNPNIVAPCEAVGYSVSCSDTFVLNYGYITIPMMSLTAFLLIIVLLLMQHLYRNN